MSKCTAAEIAEKKRIALEKLQARQSQISLGTSLKSSPVQNSGVNPHPTANHSVLPTKKVTSPIQNFYKTNSNNNKAADFLRAIEQSHTFANRNETGQSVVNSKSPEKPNQWNLHGRTSVFKDAFSIDNKKREPAPVFTQTTSCTCYLTSPSRFAVQTSRYHPQLIEVFKTIPSRSFDDHTKIWSFSLHDYQTVQEKVALLKPDVVIGSIPKNVLKLCTSPLKEPDASCLASIHPKLVNTLMPFQKEGVMFGIAKHGRLMICDEMGLGKTYQALAIADFYREDWPLFICTTASTRDVWATHVQNLLPSVLIHQISVLNTAQKYTGDARVVITSYNLMERSSEMLLEKKFGVLILDESHTLKNSKARCTAVADRLSQQARRVILLSGTPALNRPVELFSQIQMVDRSFMHFKDYTIRYCDGKQTRFGWDATGQSNLEELKIILKMKFMVRRIKDDVLPQLIEKQRETIVLDPALVFRGSNIEKTLNTFAEDLSRSKGKEKEGILLQYYAETAAIKAPAVCSYLKTLISLKNKFIVFAHHRVMIESICKFFDQQNVKYIKIDGSTRSDLRDELIGIFQKKEKCQAAVLSLRACNAGITLTAAQTVVFAELDWNPSTMAQAESRAHRIGQTNTVVCKYLIANKTADDYIWNMLKNKQEVLNKAGLFSEDVRDGTHSAAASASNRSITYYMTPVKQQKLNPSEECANPNLNEKTGASSPNWHFQRTTTNSEDMKTATADMNTGDFDQLFDEDDDVVFEDLDF